MEDVYVRTWGTNICTKCAKAPRAGRQRWCNACRAAYQREHRRRHSELSPEAKRKANARAYAKVYQKRGKLIKPDCCQRCEAKGVPLEKHHRNYSRPLMVEWLCRPCHILDEYPHANVARFTNEHSFSTSPHAA